MRALPVAVFLVAVAATCAAQDRAPVPGWRGDPRIWSLRDGVIVGDTHGIALRANSFLIRDGEVGDFELTCEVRLTGDNNSGVQYRSREVDAARFRVQGFQCDVHANPAYMAMLYDEGGRGIVAERGQFVCLRDAGREVLGRLAKVAPVDLASWHRLRIVARGRWSWHELDGVSVTAVRDERPDARLRGAIALQVHAGRPMKVEFRNLRVRALAQPDDVPVPAAVHALLRRDELRAEAARGPVPVWVWDRRADPDEEVFLRQQFQVAEGFGQARLAVSADNHCRVYVNGRRVVHDDSWETPAVVDVHEELVAGDNVVAVHAWNDGGPAGVALRLAWREGGTARTLVTDEHWRVGADDPDGWDLTGFDDSGWAPATGYGFLGAAGGTWSHALGEGALGEDGGAPAPQVAIVDPEIELAPVRRAALQALDLPVAQAVQLLEVPRSLGSWVSLGVDGQGRLYACDQGGRGIYRIEPAAALGELTTFTRMPAELSGAHGLLWWRGALYAVCGDQQTGFYRVRDSDGDDLLDRVELLRKLGGSGEHGPHSVVVAPDGEHLLVLAGNMTPLTETDASRVPRNWQEDRLVERIDDARGFWGGYSPPGGCLYEVDVGRDHWELVCCGFRNPFDLCVLPTGAIVVYDSDMEWDMGTPWYRPTRWLYAQNGVDYGWRKGTAKWPADYPDAPPPLRDIGPGSPTGMAFVPGPRGGIVGLDWTFGTVYLDAEPLWIGAPFPVVDVAFDPRRPDGIYVVTGGRGLPSKLYRLPLPEVAGRKIASFRQPVPWSERETRSPEQILADGERHGYVAARIALERLPVATFRAAALAVDAARPDRSFAGLLALARQGNAGDRDAILRALGEFDWRTLDHRQRIAWLRVHALALLRLGPVDDARKARLAQRLLPLLPSGDEREDQDLVELLAYVDAPGLLARALPLLQPLRGSPPPPWTDLLPRNAGYGGAIARMLANMPPMGQIAIAHALAGYRGEWTLAERRALFTFLQAARTRSGGASYDGFLRRIADLAAAACSDVERRDLEFAIGRARAPKEPFRASPPKGPGRDWQLADIPVLVADLGDGDREQGRNLFHAAGCAACHYFEGEGGFGGPDLTSLRSRFRPHDVLEAILAPSRVISDRYAGKVLTKKDGTALFGVVREERFGDEEFYEVMEAKAGAVPVRVPAAEVAKVEPSPLSPMPKDLLDALSAAEVRELLAFLLGRSKG